MFDSVRAPLLTFITVSFALESWTHVFFKAQFQIPMEARRHRNKPYSKSSGGRRRQTVMSWVGETVRGMFSAPSWIFKQETDNQSRSVETNTLENDNTSGSEVNPIELG